MWQVEDDEILRHLWQCQGKLPRHRAAPVVADDGGLVAPEMADDGCDVADEQTHVIALDSGWLVAQVIATLIDRDDQESIRERRHLMPPRVPEVGEAVNHDDQRGAGRVFRPERGVMD